MSDPGNLERFVDAQQGVYEHALAEIRSGRKRSHWMWFIFPQYKGLGSSAMAVRYAIGNRAEAQAYLAHPVLGARLLECVDAVNNLAGKSAVEVFGHPDDLKLRSSATLFAALSPPGSPFDTLLAKYFDGEPDPKTLQVLAAAP